MEFFRINENVVKCVITAEDMNQYDVSIEDFFTRTENAMEFIHEVMRLAEQEVDYRPDGPLTSLQITPISNKGLAIFLTENTRMDLPTVLQNLKKGAGIEISDEIMRKVENSTPSEQADFFKKLVENVHKEVEKTMRGGNSVEPRKQSVQDRNKTVTMAQKPARAGNLERKIFAFEQISDVLRYAEAVEMPGEIGSALYKDEEHGTYYLLVERKDVSVQTLAGVYLTAYEYGHFVSEKEEHAHFIKEHCVCIIAEDAIGKMKG